MGFSISIFNTKVDIHQECMCVESASIIITLLESQGRIYSGGYDIWGRGEGYGVETIWISLD